MKPQDLLAPLAVVAAMAALGVHGSWEFVAAFAVAVAFFASERVVAGYSKAAALEADVAALRAEVKNLTDTVKMSAAASQMAKRSLF